VRSQPLDEDNGPPVVDSSYQAIVVAPNVEDRAVRTDDARMSIACFDVGKKKGDSSLRPDDNFVLACKGANSGFYAAAAGAFDVVHAFVGGAEDGVDGAAVAGVAGYAGAGSDA
jgi:hypothetical protein